MSARGIDIMKLVPSRGATSLALLLSLLASGCTVGPKYKGPRDVDMPPAFSRAALVRTTPADSALPGRWWEALNDPLLTRLIEAALQNSPNVKLAEARLRNARFTVMERSAGLFPQGSVSALGGRTRIPTNALGSLSGNAGSQGSGTAAVNLFDAGFDASWEVDLFGATRRTVESARAQAQQEEARLADAHVQLAAQVAQAYVLLREAQHRGDLVRHSIEIERHTLELTQLRRDAGTASQGDIERLQVQLMQTEASLLPLQAEEDQYLDELATLSALLPGSLDSQLRPPKPVPLPPPSVAIGDPASLLRRRPDIRAAERALAASNAQIGAAVAQYFPTVRLLGSVGFVSTDTAHLFDSGSLTALGLPVLSWNVLDFGRTRAKVREAEAGYDVALAQYQAVVLSALQDAETALSRFGRERDHVIKLAAAQSAAARAAELTEHRRTSGTASVIDVLDVERQRVQTDQDLAQAQAALTNDFVALQKALGLGWAPAQAPGPG